jgi:hypothetical protein
VTSSLAIGSRARRRNGVSRRQPLVTGSP